ncbi:hypothetical protein [Mesorhizobium sp.]|uniref:hypothetical protein n=1 Tax=Mesorhizobium sp. TaxID=1871066 RepID=UPI000FE9A742|nr:hypothetical protein [Mesorhizobium sp.]RWD70279.1 MAG: type II restriction endonuclease subunit M [Mesorhizobium sp.]
MTTFFRLLESSVDLKGTHLRDAVASLRDLNQAPPSQGSPILERDPTTFLALPGTPFAYWLNDSIREVFKSLGKFGEDGRKAVVGLKTSDDSRFVRLHWEVPLSPIGERRWVVFAKGGAFSPYYSDHQTVVGWMGDGAQLWAYYEANRARTGGMIKNPDFYFRAGLTWPLRAHRFAPQALPKNCIFSLRGYCAFVPEGDLLWTLAVFNSSVFDFLFKTTLGRFGYPEFIVGQLLRLPWLRPDSDIAERLGQLARRAWSLQRFFSTRAETSCAFLLPPGLNENITCVDQGAIERELRSIQQEIDEAAFKLYGIGLEDRVAIEAFSTRAAASDASEEEQTDENRADEDDAPVDAGANALNSWLVGVAFGRFDPRLATGERPTPPEPEPFDPLASRSPGMWPEGEEPAQRADILVDDEGHDDDLASRARAVAERVHVHLPEKLRSWLAREFFPLHIKMYSKSRRKAPIYWQLATPSASYSVWLYIHAFNKDTLFRVQNDYVAPKLAHEERRLESLTNELRDNATAVQRKELAAQQVFVEELRAFLEEVKRVTPLWNPNLDDGVIINFAPLWRLVPQNKAWQKELKSTWDALCGAKYEWAHLAMYLWPERVVPNCARDRSLAIAHGFANVFWVEGSDGKTMTRKTPTRSVDELVRERTSPAVKAALKSLIEAPVANGNGGRGRTGRSRSTAATEGEDA